MIRRTVAECLFAASIALFLFVCRTACAQLLPQTGDGSPDARARSAVFASPFEEETENALSIFRSEHLEELASEKLADIQSANGNDYALGEQLVSLDLFRSLAAYSRNLPFAAESLVDTMLMNTPAGSRAAANAALLGALELYARAPLTRADVEAGLARLNRIAESNQTSSNAAAAAVQPEIYFWKAEGYRSLGEQAQAETEYRAAIEKSSDPRLTALTHFRLAELYEREERFPDADSNFSDASRIRQSPLALLSLLRLGAVERSEHQFQDVLATMDRAEALYSSTNHIIRTSARTMEYTSPLVEELLLQSTEEDRIVGRIDEEKRSANDTAAQLISPYYLNEVDLLRGSALASLGNYKEAAGVLAQGEDRIDTALDSARGRIAEDRSTGDRSAQAQAAFVADALRFERGWSLFQRGEYKDAAAAFLELAVTDTAHSAYAILRESTLPLRSQGQYFDPFLNDSVTSTQHSVPIVRHAVIENESLDTSFFIYNDFPERSRYYAGVALARAGLLDEAAQTLQKLAFTPSMLYSDQALYQLALIRFEQHSYEAQKLLEPVSYEQGVRGAYANFLLGELSYRRNDYERAEAYFLNAYAYLPAKDSMIGSTAHLERGLSLIPLGNWKDAADELEKYLNTSHEHIVGRTDEALFWMGKAYFRANAYDSAAATFSRLLSEFPTSARIEDAQYAYAWSLFEANDFTRAELEFEKVLAIDTISRYAYDALAHAADAEYAIGNNSHANTLYNRATDRPGFNPYRISRATLMMGITRMKLDSERSAMNAFQYIVRKFPESDIVDLAEFDDALSAYAINLTGEAEAMVSTIATKYRASAVAPRALYIAGEERVRRDDARGALHYYEEVVNSYPRSPQAGPALFALQDALADLRRIPDALAVADTFVARNPENPISPIVLLRAGEFQLKMKQPDRALATFRAFDSLYPANAARPRSELLIGESQIAIDDTGAARRQFDTVLLRYDSLDVAATAWLDLARLDQSEDDITSAAEEFRHAYQERYYSFDAAPSAMLEYGEMLADDGRNDSAIAVLLDLSNRYPIQASIPARGAIRAGVLLAAKERYDTARTIFRSVIAAHPGDGFGASAQVQMGEIYLSESNWTNAITAMTDAKQFPLSIESDGERLMGLARAESHLGRKAEAIRNLQLLLAMHGIAASERSSASTLLNILQPPAKRKARKGGSE